MGFNTSQPTFNFGKPKGPSFLDRLGGDVKTFASGFIPGLIEIAKAPIHDSFVSAGLLNDEYHLDNLGMGMAKGLYDSPLIGAIPRAVVKNTDPFSEAAKASWKHPGFALLDAFTIGTAGAGAGTTAAKAASSLKMDGMAQALLKRKGYEAVNPLDTVSPYMSTPQKVGDAWYSRQEYRPAPTGTKYNPSKDSEISPETVSEVEGVLKGTQDSLQSQIDSYKMKRANNEVVAKIGDKFWNKYSDIPVNWKVVNPGSRWVRNALRVNPVLSSQADELERAHALASENLRQAAEELGVDEDTVNLTHVFHAGGVLPEGADVRVPAQHIVDFTTLRNMPAGSPLGGLAHMSRDEAWDNGIYFGRRHRAKVEGRGKPAGQTTVGNAMFEDIRSDIAEGVYKLTPMSPMHQYHDRNHGVRADDVRRDLSQQLNDNILTDEVVSAELGTLAAEHGLNIPEITKSGNYIYSTGVGKEMRSADSDIYTSDEIARKTMPTAVSEHNMAPQFDTSALDDNRSHAPTRVYEKTGESAAYKAEYERMDDLYNAIADLVQLATPSKRSGKNSTVESLSAVGDLVRSRFGLKDNETLNLHTPTGAPKRKPRKTVNLNGEGREEIFNSILDMFESMPFMQDMIRDGVKPAMERGRIKAHLDNKMKTDRKHLRVKGKTPDEVYEIMVGRLADAYSGGNKNKRKVIAKYLMDRKDQYLDSLNESGTLLNPYTHINLMSNQPWNVAARNALRDSSTASSAMSFLRTQNQGYGEMYALLGGLDDAAGIESTMSLLFGSETRRGLLERSMISPENVNAYQKAIREGRYGDAIRVSNLEDNISSWIAGKLPDERQRAHEWVEELASRVDVGMNNFLKSKDGPSLDAQRAFTSFSKVRVDKSHPSYKVLEQVAELSGQTVRELMDTLLKAGREAWMTRALELHHNGSASRALKVLENDSRNNRYTRGPNEDDFGGDLEALAAARNDPRELRLVEKEQGGGPLRAHGITESAARLLDEEYAARVNQLISSEHWRAVADLNRRVADVTKRSLARDTDALSALTEIKRNDTAIQRALFPEDVYEGPRETPYYRSYKPRKVDSTTPVIDKNPLTAENGVITTSAERTIESILRWGKDLGEGFEFDASPKYMIDQMKTNVLRQRQHQISQRLSGYVSIINSDMAKRWQKEGVLGQFRGKNGKLDDSKDFVILRSDDPALDAARTTLDSFEPLVEAAKADNNIHAASLLREQIDSIMDPATKKFIEDGSNASYMIMPTPAYKTLMYEIGETNNMIFNLFKKGTNIWKATVLYMRPLGWMRNNLIGSALFLYMHDDPINATRNLRTLYKARKARKRGLSTLDARKVELIKREMPEVTAGTDSRTLLNEGLLERTNNPVSRKWNQYINFFSDLNARVADGPFRTARGLSLLDKEVKRVTALHLERTGKALDWEEAASLIVKDPVMRQKIVEAVLGDMVDFSKTSRLEREVISQMFPFWSWIKGSGRSFIRLGSNSPSKVWAMGQVAQLGDREAVADHGRMQPDFTKTWVDGPGGMTISTAGMNPFATPMEMMNLGMSLIPGGQSYRQFGTANVLSNTNPFFVNAVQALTGKNLFFGTPLPNESAGTAFVKGMVKTPVQSLLTGMYSNQTGPSATTQRHRATTLGNWAGVPLIDPRWGAVASRGRDEYTERYGNLTPAFYAYPDRPRPIS